MTFDRGAEIIEFLITVAVRVILLAALIFAVSS